MKVFRFPTETLLPEVERFMTVEELKRGIKEAFER
jgi:hypothetical protein